MDIVCTRSTSWCFFLLANIKIFLLLRTDNMVERTSSLLDELHMRYFVFYLVN